MLSVTEASQLTLCCENSTFDTLAISQFLNGMERSQRGCAEQVQQSPHTASARGTCVCVHVRVHVRLSVHSLARAGSIPPPPALPVGQSKEDPALGFQHLSPSLLRLVVPSVWKGKCVL